MYYLHILEKLKRLSLLTHTNTKKVLVVYLVFDRSSILYQFWITKQVYK